MVSRVAWKCVRITQSDLTLVVKPDQLPPAAVITRASSLEVQLSRRQAVVSRLPEHLRCVLPDECGQGPCPWLSWRSIKLILMYEVCGADMVTHSIETGFSRPVKPPPQRKSCEENDQIERRKRSESVSRPGHLLYCVSGKRVEFCIEYRRPRAAVKVHTRPSFRYAPDKWAEEVVVRRIIGKLQ